MHTLPVHFDNGRGQQLSARLDRPGHDHPRAYAVFAHCFTCSKNLSAAVNLSRGMVERGWGVLRFDFTGLGESEGDFADTHFSSNVADLIRATQWLAEAYAPPQLLVGHSLGGAAVLRAAASVPSAVAVATLGAPASPEHVRKLLGEREERTIEREGEATVSLAGRKFTIRREFLDDLATHAMQDAIAGLNRALLVMHAPADTIVGIENATSIFVAAKHPKSFVSLDQADHLLSRAEDARDAARLVASWAEPYLPPAPHGASASDDVVAWGPRRGFATELTVGEHCLLADEPLELGGGGGGPSPYSYLLGGLGACTVMTLRMYADLKRWPLDQAVCRLRHAKVHARDCEACLEAVDDPAARVDRIERVVELRGDQLSDDQRARLLEIANRCPVHRTLAEGPVVIVTRASASAEG